MHAREGAAKMDRFEKVEERIKQAGQSSLSAFQAGKLSLVEFWRKEKKQWHEEKLKLLDKVDVDVEGRIEEDELVKQANQMYLCAFEAGELSLAEYWDEEQQQRHEEKLKLYDVPLNVPKLRRVCRAFWANVLTKILQMPKPDSFKQKFTRSSRELYSMEGFPSLLWDGLDSPFQFPALRKMVQDKRAPCCVLLDVSGAGKTRTLYELATAENCLFFGCRDHSSSSEQDGSMDLLEAVTTLQRLYPVETIPSLGMNCVVGVVLLARLFLFQQFKEYFKDIGDFKAIWLFKQMMHRFLSPIDPFFWLVKELFKLLETKALQSLDSDLFREVAELAHSLGMKTVIIDECQLIQPCLSGRFGDEKKPSFLYALVETLYSFGFRNVYVSGTGYNLFHIESKFARMLKPTTGICRFQLEGFGSPGQLRAFTQRYVENTNDFDFNWLFGLYSGRYRFYVTALEHFLHESNKPSFSSSPNDFMYEFARKVVTQRAVALRLPAGKSIFDQVKSFFERHSDENVCALVQALVLLYFFGGAGCPQAGFESRDLQLVNCGLARLAWKKTGDNSLHALSMEDIAQVDTTWLFTVVQVAEPLVLWAVWEYLEGNPLLLRKWQLHDFARKAVSHLESEKLLGLPLHGELFDGKIPTQVLRPIKGWHSMDRVPAYERVYRLCQPNDKSGPLLQTMSPEGSPVKDWIDSIMSNKERFPVYLHSGPVELFGPDLLFMLETCDGGEKSHLLVLCQVTTGKQSTRLESGWSALDIRRLYLRKNVSKRSADQETDYKAIKELTEKGCIKLVAVTPSADLQSGLGDFTLDMMLRKQEAVVEDYMCNLKDDGGYDLDEEGEVFVNSFIDPGPRERKRKKSMTSEVPPLLGVIDQNTIYSSESLTYTDVMKFK